MSQERIYQHSKLDERVDGPEFLMQRCCEKPPVASDLGFVAFLLMKDVIDDLLVTDGCSKRVRSVVGLKKHTKSSNFLSYFTAMEV